jgi:two-component system LytT family sensor kinase
MKIQALFRDPWTRIIGIPVTAVVMTSIVLDPGENAIKEFFEHLLFITVIWNGDYYIIRRFRRMYPELTDTFKRIASTISVILIYNLLADYVVCTFLGFFEVGGFRNYFDDEFGQNISMNFITTLIVGSIYEAAHLFEKWKKKNIEVEEMKNQQLRSELNVLKNQISPHFLFNSLNTLVTFIHENPDNAVKFTEKLSQVYRYILEHKDKEIIKLKTEIEFVIAYNFLLSMRYEKGLDITMSIEDSILEKYVAPLTVQMLVENAVKHNVISISRPLKLDIYVENGKSLIVRNNLQRKRQGVKSTKTGLKNIKQRYTYLSEREVDIIETRDFFMVALPLIEISEEPQFDTV